MGQRMVHFSGYSGRVEEIYLPGDGPSLAVESRPAPQTLGSKRNFFFSIQTFVTSNRRLRKPVRTASKPVTLKF